MHQIRRIGMVVGLLWLLLVNLLFFQKRFSSSAFISDTIGRLWRH